MFINLERKYQDFLNLVKEVHQLESDTEALKFILAGSNKRIRNLRKEALSYCKEYEINCDDLAVYLMEIWDKKSCGEAIKCLLDEEMRALIESPIKKPFIFSQKFERLF